MERKTEKDRWRGFFETLTRKEEWKPHHPRNAIQEIGRATLWHYPAVERNGALPILMVYSHINKPSILDLTEQHSMIGEFLRNGYDVFLLDFGIPDERDKDTGLESYLFDYIDGAVKTVLQHQQTGRLTLAGFCLGGTLAALYAALYPDRIHNLLLFVTPIDFNQLPDFREWIKAIQSGEIDPAVLAPATGIIPAEQIRYGMRLITAPVYYSPYLSLLNRAYDPAYTEHWYRFNQWTNDHVPMTGAFLRDLLHYFIKQNALMNGGMTLRGREINLAKIQSNVYMVCSKFDQMVPAAISYPLMELVSSEEKQFIEVPGGHASLIKDGVSSRLMDWLREHS